MTFFEGDEDLLLEELTSEYEELLRTSEDFRELPPITSVKLSSRTSAEDFLGELVLLGDFCSLRDELLSVVDEVLETSGFGGKVELKDS